MANTRRKGKGGKPREFTPKDDKRGGFRGHNCNNDVKWYTQYPKLVEASSSIIFNTPYGGQYHPILNANTRVKAVHTIVPGAIGLGFDTFQCAKGSNTDPINVAARNLYTWVRHANSGSVNYESSDMIQYIYTVANLAAHIETLRRVLRLSYTFSPVNRYTYVADLVATGWTEANIALIRTNLANFTAEINRVIAKFNTFKLPKDMHFITRWKWMSSSVFKDDNLDKATHYLFYPRTIAHYDWANRVVEFNSLPFSTLTFNSYISLIENEIENLISYEDIGIMIGDILKAYKAEGCMVTEPVSMGEVIDPYFSEEVLTQIRNATVLNRDYQTSAKRFSLHQVSTSTQLVQFVDDFVLCAGVGVFCATGDTVEIQNANQAGNGTTMVINPYLSLASDNPTSDEVIVATRLSNTIKTNVVTITDSGGTTYYHMGIEHSGSEIISKCRFVTMNDNYSGTDQFSVFDYGSSFEWLNTNTNSRVMIEYRRFAFMSRISYTPYKIFLFPSTMSTPHTYETLAIYAGKNLLTPSEDWLTNLHAGCVLSEFSIPMFKLLETNN